MRRLLAALAAFGLLSSCAKRIELDETSACTMPLTTPTAGERGQAYVFSPDPISSSGIDSLTPRSTRLDDFRSQVELQRLGGRGVLEGAYVDVRNGLCAGRGFGAFSETNQFEFSRENSSFQEAMSYYFGDRYRAKLDEVGYLQPKQPVRIVAHCGKQDNAYFWRGVDVAGQPVEEVCLGESVASPGSYYADDATVVLHELEHATTVDTYSLTQELNQFIYDEAGAMNEAISDFMALISTAPDLRPTLDPRVFSRWALGTFIPDHVGVRGAHRCPQYDPTYPNCTGYHADASGFSARANTVSYAYPDGVGWPYANNYAGPGVVRQAFLTYGGQEEIHGAGMVVTGALWDVYEALKEARGGSLDEAQRVSTKLVLEAIKHLPKPSYADVSPVTFRELGSALVASGSLVGLSDSERAAVEAALTARGLVGGTPLPADWAGVGSGAAATPGLALIDKPSKLRSWAYDLGGPGGAALITQGLDTGLNGLLDPGETVIAWLDVRNLSERTAGGLALTVSSDDPDLELVDERLNWGYDPNTGSTQIRYGKVNGTAVVAALASADVAYHVPTGPTYFQTNPFYGNTPVTGIWLKASPRARHGKSVSLRVRIAPSNGPETTVLFPITIQ